MITTLMPLAVPFAGSRAEGFDAFLQAIYATPLLEGEREMELAKRAQEDDAEAAQQLALSNLRYVVWLARRYIGYGLPLPDLVQEGTAGLLKAIRRFDPACGVRLISYATHWIRSEIHEYILRHWQIVRRATTKAQRKLFFRRQQLATLEGASEEGQQEALARNLNVSLEELHDMRERLAGSDVSLDIDMKDGSGWHPVDRRDPLCLLEEAESERRDAPRLRAAIASLDSRSRDILVSRWLSEPALSLAALGARYGISVERVRQIQNRAMGRVREALELNDRPVPTGGSRIRSMDARAGAAPGVTCKRRRSRGACGISKAGERAAASVDPFSARPSP